MDDGRDGDGETGDKEDENRDSEPSGSEDGNTHDPERTSEEHDVAPQTRGADSMLGTRDQDTGNSDAARATREEGAEGTDDSGADRGSSIGSGGSLDRDAGDQGLEASILGPWGNAPGPPSLGVSLDPMPASPDGRWGALAEAMDYAKLPLEPIQKLVETAPELEGAQAGAAILGGMVGILSVVGISADFMQHYSDASTHMPDSKLWSRASDAAMKTAYDILGVKDAL